MRFGGRRPLTMSQQYLNLRINPISAGKGSVRAGRLVWRCEVSPSPLSRTYSIRIECQHGKIPKIFVEAPDLAALADGRQLPHVYQQEPPQLCLFLPKTGEWANWKRIDQTIIPWSALWFFYFEDWLRSGEWNGGGVHPPVSGESRHNGDAEESE